MAKKQTKNKCGDRLILGSVIHTMFSVCFNMYSEKKKNHIDIKECINLIVILVTTATIVSY